MKLMKTLAMATLLASLSTSLVQADTRVFLRTTDNVSGAGTDSNIWMRLHGSNGKQSKRLRLQDVIVWHEQWQSNGVPLGVIDDILEGGVTGYFDVSTDLGQAITKIDIESDGRYPGSDWHLDRVISFTESGDNKISTWGIPLMMSVAVSGEVDGYTSLGGISTFVWEDWIKGDEEKLTGTDGRKARGIEIVRKEPMTKKNGKGETVAAVIQIVYVANALGSTSKATNSFKYTTTRHESLRQVDNSSTSIKIGAAVSYGYQPASASGGNKWEASLSSEFQHVSGNINEQVFGTDS
jgi:hypothetical protein